MCKLTKPGERGNKAMIWGNMQQMCKLLAEVCYTNKSDRRCTLNRGFLIAYCKTDEDNPSVMAGVDCHSTNSFNLAGAEVVFMEGQTF